MCLNTGLAELECTFSVGSHEERFTDTGSLLDENLECPSWAGMRLSPPWALGKIYRVEIPLRVLGTLVPIASWDQLHPTGLKVSLGDVLRAFGTQRWVNKFLASAILVSTELSPPGDRKMTGGLA